MPFLAKEHVPISTKDILSWIYDEPVFDQNKHIYIDANDPSNFISAAHAKILIRQLIAGFQHAGLKKGDVVLIHSFNSIYYPIIVLGIIGCGAINTGTNPSYTSYELTYAIRSSQAKLIICDPDVLGDRIVTAAKDCGVPTEKILALDSAPISSPAQSSIKGFNSWRTLLSHGEEDWIRFDDKHTSENTTALLFFSSGTTGLPKLTQLSHYNLIAQHTLVFEHQPRPYALKRLVALPMFHAATAPSTHISPLRAGHPQFIMRRFEPTAFLDNVKKFQITDLILVPPQVTSLLSHPLPVTRKQDRLKSVKCVYGGGAPLDSHTQSHFQTLLPTGSPFTQIWAMTETCCFASLFPYPEDDDTGSVGRFLPNIDVKILDDEGNEITTLDQPGELAIRGPTVTKGYVGVARAKDFDAEGYFRTGDVMYVHGKTGLWYIIDRKKDLIKVRGFQVAPAELEGVLLEHPGVADVAVIGAKSHGGNSESPRAYIVRKADVELEEGEVKQWVEAKLAKYKSLDGGVRFVESIPKSPSGKILKRLLRDRAEKEMGTKL
ncbi:AMP-binding enzyme [Cucurbitaria berberidis CBS 394.84]|uniref:AMP-binding enzyme n=1 Tax=Cucurbitaria berberidis CBS 394.84 TaxID=1168544 RepID=A0A9P4L4U1_9PLEO|nr:AMP-binding enzyme [Cucurbitaria berberidis CBS 394.84]KAF1841669.1 AMP-binding enzyme [Cucurbitaria berberidis CBS 394.84]